MQAVNNFLQKKSILFDDNLKKIICSFFSVAVLLCVVQHY